MTSTFTEFAVEDAALEFLRGIGWSLRHGLEIAPGEAGAERADYAQVVLEARQTLSRRWVPEQATLRKLR